MNNLKKEFEWARQIFFPRWDRDHRWRFSTDDRKLVHLLGLCDSKNRVVVIPKRASQWDITELRGLIIHEITHAVTDCGHGKSWRARMETSASKAQEMGLTDLASKIRREIQWYADPKNCDEITAAQRYHQIEVLVFIDPQRSLREIIQDLSDPREMSFQQFLKKYRRCAHVYEQAKKFRNRFSTYSEAAEAKLRNNSHKMDWSEDSE